MRSLPRSLGPSVDQFLLQDVAQVVVFLPVGGDFGIDLARFFVENLHGIAVGTDWAVDGLPDVELLAGARMGTERELILIATLRGGDGVAEIVAVAGLRDLGMRTLDVEGVRVFVQIDVGVGAEVDGVGARDECAVVVIGIKHLHGDRFPAAGAATVDEARPALANGTELLFERGDEFGLDGFAVGAEVGGVDGVGIVVVGIRVIDLRDEQTREFRCDPLLVKLVLLFLLDAVVAGDVEAFAEVGLQIRIGRLGAEAFEVVIEVIFKNCEREVRAGMLVEAFGDEDVGAEKHWAAPEFCEELALDAHVADVFGVFGRGDGGNFLIE